MQAKTENDSLLSMRCLRLPSARGATALALLWLVALTAGQLHPVVEAHSYCAEHADWTHADSEVATDPAKTAVATQHLASGSPLRPGDAMHDHCTLLTNRRDTALAVPDAAGALPLPEQPPALVALSRDSRAAATATYRLAPKHSPPALA